VRKHLTVIRSCGECAACCEVMAIIELAKPVHQECPHQLKLPVIRPVGAPKLMGSCGIYSKRPAECRTFACLWLAETDRRLMKYAKHRKAQRIFKAADKPNISGILLHSPEKEVSPLTRATGMVPVNAREVWPGAAEEEAGQDLLERFSERFLVILIRGDRRTIMGPPEQLQKVNMFLEARVR